MVRSSSSPLSVFRWPAPPTHGHMRRLLQILVAVVMITASVGIWATVSSASAVSAFEITDANIVDDPPAAPLDWASLFTSTGADKTVSGILARSFIADSISSDPLPAPCKAGSKGDPTTLVSGGSDKNGDPINTLEFEPNAVPHKDDITNVYSAALLDGADTVFYFGLERAETEGDSHVDFEFLRAPIALEVTGTDNATGCDVGHWVGTRSPGDILVSMDFTSGGALGTPQVRVWVGDASSGSYQVQTLPEGSVGFFTNNVAIECGDWGCRNSTGGAQSQLQPRAFVEGYLNVSRALGTSAVGCYSTFDAKTRTSQSWDSELKDFALGSFDTCDARISLTPSGLNEVGTTHTMTAKVETNANGTFAPLAAATVNGTTSLGSFVGGSSCVTDPNGECDLTITSSASGTSMVNVSTTVDVGAGRAITRSTSADAGPGGSGPATKHWVDAGISIVQTATNEVDNEHVFMVTVTPIAPAGVTVSNVSIAPSVTPAPATTATTCDSNVPVSGGVATCTYTVNNPTAGVFDVDASAVVSYSSATFTEEVARSTTANAGPGGNTGATKTFVDASIAITGTATNNVNDAHVFTVTATAIPAGDATVVFDSVSTSLAPTPGSVSTTCDQPSVSGNVATCTLTINSSVAGVFVADATVRLTVGGVSIVRSTDPAIASSGPDGSGPATKTYVVTGPSVLGEIVTRGPAPAAAVPVAPVAPAAVALAATGLDPVPPLALSVVLILGGGLLLMASRRRLVV